MNHKPIHIAVLDDHALILEAIKSLISDRDDLVFVKGSQDFDDLLPFLQTAIKLDILLLDIQLHSEDGLKLCGEIKQLFPQLHIIMLSGNTQPSVVMNALHKGASGFLPKNISLEDLLHACTTALNGGTFIHPNISFKNDLRTSRYDENIRLTRREKEVLGLILNEFTTAQIAQELNVTVSTVETHRASLFLKTDSKNVVGLIKATIEKGLLD